MRPTSRKDSHSRLLRSDREHLKLEIVSVGRRVNKVAVDAFEVLGGSTTSRPVSTILALPRILSESRV